MSERIREILSRVLSAEIGNQEIWKEQDLERFSCDKIGRDEIIEEIRQFMKDNDIKFDDFSYFNTKRQYQR